MGDMTITEPFVLVPSPGAAPNYDVSGTTSGLANLATYDPREIWVGATGSTPLVSIDLGANRDFDTIALVNCNGGPTATWTISCGTSVQGHDATFLSVGAAMRVASEDIADPTGAACYVSATMLNKRYIRLYLYRGSGDPALTAGFLFVGKSWKPGMPREHGAGRPPIDTGSRQRLDNGGLAIVPGALLSGLKWVFGDMDPADLAKLWGILRRRRTTEPVLLLEDPGALVAEGVHWGTFVSLEAYERRDQSKSRWALQLEDYA